MSIHRVVCGYVLLMLVGAASEGYGQELVISTPRSELLCNEPLSINVSGILSSKPSSLIVEVKDVGGGDTRAKSRIVGEISGELLTVQSEENGQMRVSSNYVLHLDPQDARCVFRIPGKYSVRVSDGGSACSSNALDVLVQPAAGEEGAASDMFNQPSLISAMCGGRSAALEEDPLALFVSKHPASRFTPYVSYFLLMRKYEELKRGRALVIEEHERYLAQYGALADTYKDMVALIPVPSLWHSHASVILAQCYARSGRYDEGRTMLVSLLELYPSGIVHDEMRSMLDELDAFLEKRK